MKSTLAKLVLTLAVMVPLAGCGSDSPPPRPAQAEPKESAPHPADKPWTKAEKIDMIKKSGMPKDRQKAEIDKVNAEPG